MAFTIGEVAEQLQFPASTLRYYEKEGLLSKVPRSDDGMRLFLEIDTLRMIECLKTTGRQIKEIRLFPDWCAEGENTLRFVLRKQIRCRTADRGTSEDTGHYPV